MAVVVKRIYDKVSANDGARVLDVALVTAIDYDKAPEGLGDNGGR